LASCGMLCNKYEKYQDIQTNNATGNWNDKTGASRISRT
jgi:hypothetical protein